MTVATESMLNLQSHDGSRQFAALPQRRLWYDVRDHVEKLDGAQLTAFVTDDITEAWIEFQFRRHSFAINDQFGEYWFFVRDPSCPDTILAQVTDHFEVLLTSSQSLAHKVRT